MDHSSKNLYNRIISGEFDESPYWKEAENQKQLLESEIVTWREQNPRAHELSFENWFIYRRQMYNRRIEKLKVRHQEEEVKRLLSLIEELNHACNCDCSLLLSSHEGDILSFYRALRNLNNNP